MLCAMPERAAIAAGLATSATLAGIYIVYDRNSGKLS